MKHIGIRTASPRHLTLIGFILGMATAGPTSAQEHDPGILRAVEAAYAGISANTDESRDWQAFHALFVPNARLIHLGGDAERGVTVNSWSVAEWIVQSGLGLEGRGFVEDFVHSRIESYGPIAHVFTTWVTRSARGGPERSQGAATLQLVHTDEGWRIASWIWTGEREGVALAR